MESKALKNYISTVDDFPTDGVRFYDISPLLSEPAAFLHVIEEISEPLENKVTKVVGYDARGFIFGGAVALRLGVGFAMLRKPNKLPGETHLVQYDLEYGSNSLEIQTDSVKPTDEVLLIDDVIATGGTALSGIELVRKTGASIVEFCSLIDLPHLGGSEKISQTGVAVRSLVSFEDD